MFGSRGWSWLESGLAVLVLLPLLALGFLGSWFLQNERTALDAAWTERLQRDAAVAAAEIDRAVAARILGLQDALVQAYAFGGFEAARNIVLVEPMVRLATIDAPDGTRLMPPDGIMMLPLERTLAERSRGVLEQARDRLDMTDGIAWSGSALEKGALVVACRRALAGEAVCLLLDDEELRNLAIATKSLAGRETSLELVPTGADRSGVAIPDGQITARATLSQPFSGWAVALTADLPAQSSWHWLLLVLAPLVVAVLAVAGLVLWTVRQRASQARRRIAMLAQVSHELRTPLANIGLYGSLLARRGADDPEIERYSTVIDSEVERLSLLIDNALACARAGYEVRSETATGDPDAIARTVVDRLSPLLEASGGVHLEPGVGAEKRFDVTAFERILVNLLDNARKYAPGKRITLRTALERDGGEETLLLTVEDDGPGLAEAPRRRLFEAFEGGQGTDGFGLGLAACRALAEAAGGRILHYDAAPGAGFRLRLPVVEGGREASA